MKMSSPPLLRPLVRIFRHHQDLPRMLRVHWLAPLCALLIGVLGLSFSLPPGPLCDDGMILFMEGGCDWGLSNIFFWSKAGLLLTVNVLFLIQILARPGARPSLLAYGPHLALAVGLAALNHSASHCVGYYPQPNGSVGQMILEVTAFALLGLSLARQPILRTPFAIAPTFLAWNAVHVGLFYAWLPVRSHWTWEHTGLVVLSLVGLAALLEWTARIGWTQDALVADR